MINIALPGKRKDKHRQADNSRVCSEGGFDGVNRGADLMERVKLLHSLEASTSKTWSPLCLELE